MQLLSFTRGSNFNVWGWLCFYAFAYISFSFLLGHLQQCLSTSLFCTKTFVTESTLGDSLRFCAADSALTTYWMNKVNCFDLERKVLVDVCLVCICVKKINCTAFAALIRSKLYTVRNVLVSNIFSFTLPFSVGTRVLWIFQRCLCSLLSNLCMRERRTLCRLETSVCFVLLLLERKTWLSLVLL